MKKPSSGMGESKGKKQRPLVGIIVFMKTLAFGEGFIKSSTPGTMLPLKHAPMGHVQATRYAGGC